MCHDFMRHSITFKLYLTHTFGTFIGFYSIVIFCPIRCDWYELFYFYCAK